MASLPKLFVETIYVGSDHGGFELKKAVLEFLSNNGYKAVDLGPFSYDKDDDYPDYAQKVGKAVVENKALGILICRSGHGMVIASNKINGVYASVCWSELSAKKARIDDGLNVMCIPADYVTSKEAEKIVMAWLAAPPLDGERFRRRLNKIKDIEKEK